MLTIYKASAGSGKTFTLTYEYLKTLLGVQKNGGYVLNHDKHLPGGRHMHRHRAIMAITFTTTATDEMKQRIIAQVAQLANSPADSPYVGKLTKLYKCSAAELQQSAAAAMAELLLDYSSFNVSTIDSFFQSVLRTFSREIDQQGDYELLIDNGDTVRQSISLMLDELNYGTPPHSQRLLQWLSEHTLENVVSGRGYNFFDRNGALLGNLAYSMEKCMDEEYYKNADRLRQYLRHPSRLRTFENELSAKMAQLITPLQQMAQRMLDIAAAAWDSSVAKNLRPRLELLAKPDRKIDIASFKLKIFGLARDEITPADVFGSKEKVNSCSASPFYDEFMELARTLCPAAKAVINQYNLYSVLRQSLGTLDFIGMASDTMEQMLRQNNAMLISDTTDLLRRIISDAEMPFIYERLGMRLETLLIDEFQDTSRMQWKNLRPLVANSVAQGFDNLIIGDEKQSIYRFRNSDSELLGKQVPLKDFPEHLARGSEPADNTNHRSSGAVVMFNNTIFHRLAPALGAEHFRDVIQTPSEKRLDSPAYVRVDLSPKEPYEAFETMAQDILRQHNDGYRWSDIMILARTRSEISKIISFLLDKHPEISVMSNESLLLDNSPAVRSIVSMLKLVQHSYAGRRLTGDSTAKYGSRSDYVLMTSRYRHYANESADNAEALERALDNSAGAGDELQAQIDAIRAKNPANIVALVDAVIAEKIPADQRRQHYAYIAALQDRVLQHAQSAEPSLAAFLADYDANAGKWSVMGSSGIDAVKVMSVHSAKGLEAPCVHIPRVNWELFHNSQTMWVDMEPLKKLGFTPDAVPPMLHLTTTENSPLTDEAVSPFAGTFDTDRNKEIMDNLNVTYVAFTRAGRELIIQNNDRRGSGNIAEYMAPLFSSRPDGDIPEHTIDLSEYFDGTVFTLGRPTTPEPTKEEAGGIMPLDPGEYIVNYRSDTRELVSVDDALAVSTVDDDDEYPLSDNLPYDTAPAFEGTEEMRLAARRGQNLHAILASMRTLADLDSAVRWQCSRQRVSDEEAESYRRDLAAAIDAGGTAVQQWFSPWNSILAERSIYIPGAHPGDEGRTLRPDRVIVDRDNNATVIDYKFTAEKRASHRRQVQEYMQILARMGYAGVQAFLWYPLHGDIVAVRADSGT